MDTRVRGVVAGLLLGLAASVAQPGLAFEWEQVTEADWAVAEDPDKDIRDAVMIFEKIRVDDENMVDRKTYYSVYRRIRILSGEGRSWGDVVAPYIKKTQKLEDIQGRTLHRDGDVFDLKESYIFDKEVVAGEGTKVKQKAFSLPAVSEDCIIEYYVKYRLDESPHVWIIQKDIHMLDGEYVWRFCRGRGLRGTEFRNFAKTDAPNYVVLHAEEHLNIDSRPSLKDPDELVFTIEDVPAFRSEPFSLPDIALKWQMRHYYGEPGVAASFWGDICRDFEANLKEFTSYNDRLQKVIENFPYMSSDLERVNTAYDWLNSNIRNVNLDESDEEVEGNGCVDHVVMHGYGNSLEISSLFYDMLREMEIDAKMAFGINRNENMFIPDAKYWQFDRSLVAVPQAGGGYAFYKPGYDYLAPGQLDWYNEGTTALVVGDPDEQFFAIPISDAAMNEKSRSLELTIGEDLHLAGTMTEEATGQPARLHRIGMRKSDNAGVKQYLKECLAGSVPTFDADSLAVENLENNRRTLGIRCLVEANFEGQQVGSRLLLMPSDLFSKHENPFTTDERAHEIDFNYAHRTIESIDLDMPERWAVETVPSDTTFSNRVGECRISFKVLESGLSIESRFTIAEPVWQPEAYEDIKKLFQARKTFSETTVVISRP